MQDNTLFNTSIKENLQYANKNASLEEIKEAIKNAEAGFVYNLDK
jgi:ABC-type multidrug transport system fused ATPase/permease subunit